MAKIDELHAKYEAMMAVKPACVDSQQWEKTHRFARNLTNEYPYALSFLGKPTPGFQGREAEVSAVRQSLSKRRIRSCVLIGPPGIGKTEIVKKALSEANTKDLFLRVDVGSIISGCTLVGMVEERVERIFKAITEFNSENVGKCGICLFVDEIHTLFAANKSKTNASVPIADMLKPMLADGTLTIIGATTKDDYDETIKSDKALLRRLPPIFVSESDDPATSAIVSDFAGTSMSAKAVAKCVELSHGITYLNNPDCALEIADRAISKAMAEKRKAATENDVIEVVSMMAE